MAFVWVLAVSLLSLTASSADIVLFGDSLSDSGDAGYGYSANAKYVLRSNETYPQDPYYEGRWSNGPTWIEVAAALLGQDLTDYGAGGATTGLVPAQVPPLPVGFANITVPTTVLSPTLLQQLDHHFLRTNNSLSAAPLYFIFIGANDYFSIVFQNTSVTADAVTGYIGDAMAALYDKGARKFVLVSEPGLSGIPAFNKNSTYGFYPNATIQRMKGQNLRHNVLLQQLATSFPRQHPGASTYYYDFASSFDKIVNNATAEGFTDTKNPCYTTAPNLAANDAPSAQPIGLAGGTLCSNPDAHIFWDQFHPSKGVHQLLGAAFVNQTRNTLFTSS